MITDYVPFPPAPPHPGPWEVAYVSRVVDGDTFHCFPRLPYMASADIEVRFRSFDAIEKNQPGGLAATEDLAKLLSLGPVRIYSVKYERSFTRWICDVFVFDRTGWINVASEMIALGHRKPA